MSNKNIQDMIAEIDDYDDQIYLLQQPIADKLNDLQTKKMEATDALNAKLAKQAGLELSQKDYGCGTVNLDFGRYGAKVTVSKKVKWDDKELRAIANKIREAGQDPEVYIQYKLNVTETAYKGFPEAIQKEFEPARTVEPSAPKIEIVRK